MEAKAKSFSPWKFHGIKSQVILSMEIPWKQKPNPHLHGNSMKVKAKSSPPWKIHGSKAPWPSPFPPAPQTKGWGLHPMEIHSQLSWEVTQRDWEGMGRGWIAPAPREAHARCPHGQAPAMSQPRLLLLLVLLGAAGTGRALSLSSAASVFSCLNAALAEARRIHPEENAVLEKRGSEAPSLEEVSEEEEDGEEDLGKRTFPGDGHYKHASQAQGKGKSHQNRAKSDRRTKVTLSLDVPTNIMNILFNIAKAKNLRAKAAANAHLMAQIGRRK